MKKLLVLLAIIGFNFTYAQLSMTKLDGTPINDGDLFLFTSNVYPASYLGFKMFNNSDNDIRVKCRVVSITNAPGSNVQLCLGDICVFNVTVGNAYPNAGAIIEANGSNGNFDHFENQFANTGGTFPVDYVLKFFILNAQNQEVGNSIQFTYRFNPNAASVEESDLKSMGIKLSQTVVSSNFEVEAEVETNLYLTDINGKVVRQLAFSGTRNIDLSELQGGMYFARFESGEKVAVVKILKK